MTSMETPTYAIGQPATIDYMNRDHRTYADLLVRRVSGGWSTSNGVVIGQPRVLVPAL